MCERWSLLLVAFAVASTAWSQLPDLSLRRGLVLVAVISFGIYLIARYDLSEVLRLAARVRLQRLLGGGGLPRPRRLVLHRLDGAELPQRLPKPRPLWEAWFLGGGLPICGGRLTGAVSTPSALTHTFAALSLSSFAVMALADAVQTNGLGSALCSAR